MNREPGAYLEVSMTTRLNAELLRGKQSHRDVYDTVPSDPPALMCFD